MARPSAYRDFDVAVERDGDDLEVRVLASPAGETATVRTAVPAAMWSAATAGPNTATEGRDAGPAGGTAAEPSDLNRGPEQDREMGTALFGAVFAGDVLVRWRDSLRRATADSNGLRLVLRFGDGADVLPWELLWDPEHRRFLALDAATPVVRCTEMPARDAVPPIDGPLRVLIAVSAPAGAGPLDTARERALIEGELERVRAGRALEIDILESASLNAIREHVEGLPVHVFHYIGHGARLDDGSGGLVLTGPDGRPSIRRAEEIAAVLGPVPSLRLAVLNSCHGSLGDADDPFAGAASSLVKAGIPAVIAMRRSISDVAAIAFAAELYDALVDGARIEAAVAAARAALFASAGTMAKEWSTVALHLGSSLGADLTASPLPRLDDDVQFTVSRPRQLRATRWEPMLVFAHRAEPYEGPAGETIDPKAEVAQRIAGFFGPELSNVATTSDDARGALPRGAQLVVVPDLPDVQCEPARAPLTWTGEISEVRFLLRAGSHRIGSTVHGWLRIFCGPLMIAETALELAVVADGGEAPSPPLRNDPMPRYRRIFPCFSPEDSDLVVGVAAVAEALGDQYAADVIDARRSGAPDEWMLSQIADADVFQLFWSSHSMQSSSCQRQWDTALAVDKNEFIRPLYWEDPFPRADGLPPSGLAALRFVRVPGPTTTTTDALWTGTPAARAAAPPGLGERTRPTIAPPSPPISVAAPAPAPFPPPSWPGPAPSAAPSQPATAPSSAPRPPVFAPPPPTGGRRRRSGARWWMAPAMAALVAVAAAGVLVTNLGRTVDDDASPPATTSDDPSPPPTDDQGLDSSPPSVVAPTTAAPPTTPAAADDGEDGGSSRLVSVLAGLVAVVAAAVALVGVRRRRPR